MSDKYNEVLKQLYAKRRDFLFQPSLLDTLDEEERKDIENKIVKLCLSGDQITIKYIQSLKYIDLNNTFTIDKIKQLNNDNKTSLLSELYNVTKNDAYLYELLDIAEKDIYAYGKVTDLYNELPDLEKNQIYKKLEDLSKKDAKYDFAFRERVKGEDVINNAFNKKKVEAGVIGFAVGDALGVPIEFTSRDSHKDNPLTEMVGYGTHNVPEGTWSDDTSMTIAAMDSIGRLNGTINYDHIMASFCSWAQRADYTATNKVFDIGIGTQTALSQFVNKKIPATQCGGIGINNNGNGSLMRMLPIVYYLYHKKIDDKEARQIIKNYSSLTHGHEISQLGCNIYYDYMKMLLDGIDKEEAFNKLKDIDYSDDYSEETINNYKRILDGSLSSEPIDKISSSGYVVHTLEACLWTLLHTNSYEEAVVTAVNLGDDTDTVGAITGSMAGTIYGYENIPKRWLDKLQNKSYIDDIIDNYYKSVTHKVRISGKFSDYDDFIPKNKAK